MIRVLALVTSLLVIVPGFAGDPQRRAWKVDGVAREALVYVPDAPRPAPLVFAFHGHGGTMKAAAEKWAYHKRWPQAICVYMQGLPTPGKLTDPEGRRPGWQHEAGEQGDRDLKFFDAVLSTLRREAKVDEQRIYVTGHSNGGRFTYLLWAVRGDVFAAVAPSGSAATTLIKELKPRPCLHVAGAKDPLVKFEWQKKTIDAIRTLNGCSAEGERRGNDVVVYPSSSGTPLSTYVYPGGHAPPADAPDVIVAFLKQHSRDGRR